MSDTTMRAVRFHAYGGSDQLVLETVARPTPGPHEVLVRVVASGVNGLDWKIRAGQFRTFRPLPLPAIPGIELAGLIESVGSEVTRWQPGDAVYGAGVGTYAEFAIASDESISARPKGISFAAAAAVPVGAQTAWLALFDLGGLVAGQRVLIHGAAGGVGSYAVQLARWRGAHVAGTSSGGNLEFVRSLGVEQAIDYASTPFERAVHDVDVVVDMIGGETQARSWQVLRPGGILIAVGSRADEQRAQEHGVRTATTILGPTSGPPRQGAPLVRISELIEGGVLVPQVGRTFDLADAAAAQALSETGHGRGRIVLHVADA
jgi:NADPH:quinone reductase-like Zn-dependent oxidoreductase